MSVDKEVIAVLQEFGVTSVLLPFLLSFAVVWGALDRTKLLGTHQDGSSKNTLNLILAFVIGLFFVYAIAHTASYRAVLQVVLYLTLSFFALIFIAGIVFGSEWHEQKWLKVVAGVMALGIIGFVLRLHEHLERAGWLVLVLFALLAGMWVVYYVFAPSAAGASSSQSVSNNRRRATRNQSSTRSLPTSQPQVPEVPSPRRRQQQPQQAISDQQREQMAQELATIASNPALYERVINDPSVPQHEKELIRRIHEEMLASQGGHR